MIWRLLLLILTVFFTACSQSLKVKSLPQQTIGSRLFAVEQFQPKHEKSLLSVQFFPEYWRWVQTDPLGSPIARLQLTEKGWQNDGFIMPNSQAEILFSAIATYLNPNHPLFEFSQIKPTTTGQNFFIKRKKMWQMTPHKNGVALLLNDNSHWSISEIE